MALEVPVRHGYPWVPTDQPHGRPRQVGPAYQKTRQPVSGPNWPSRRPTRPPEDLPGDSPNDLVHHNLKTWRTRQDFGGFRPKQIDGICKMCNVDLGLLRPGVWELTSSADQYKADETIHCVSNQSRNPQAVQTEELDLAFYSPEARTSINSPCSLCSAYSCATFEFLALDFTPTEQLNYRD
jgi:hypothetical protein